MKLYYVANARMPSEKAHGIQIAKMCEALILQGIEVELVVPNTRHAHGTLREYYGLSAEVPLVKLPVIDTYLGGPFWYAVSALSFMCSYICFFWWKRLAGAPIDAVYTVDLDNFSYLGMRLTGYPYFSEFHGGKEPTLRHRFYFKRMQGAVAINDVIREEVEARFGWEAGRILVEPNGVDVDAFERAPKKAEARTRLGLPEDAHIAVYTGRFFAWKGLEVLPAAMRHAPDTQLYILGGDAGEFEEIVGKVALPPNLHFVGARPYLEMPLWQAAADTLIVLGTRANEYSYRYTSPMKLFEYAASRRPIIAADTPAIREYVGDGQVIWYAPDDAEDLARRILETRAGSFEDHVEAVYAVAMQHTWLKRALRARDFIARRLAIRV